MESTMWFVLSGYIIFNVITVYFFFTEKLLEKQEDNDKSCDYRNRWIYVIVFLIINLGITFLFCFYYKQNSVMFVWKRLGLLSILWAVGYIDYKTCKVPNRFILLGLGYRVSILVLELFVGSETFSGDLISEGIAATVLVIAALLCSVCVKHSIGFGDIKLFIVMGLLLGFESVWSAMFVSLLITFFVALGLLILRKKTRKDAIPFAPSLMIGTYISICLTGM